MMRARICSARFAPSAALCAVVLGAALVLSTSQAAEPATRTVEIANFAFVPKEITVEPGTRLRWTNHDETPHTVTSQGGTKVLSSPGLDVGDQYEFVFSGEGDFAYFCTVHPMMTGVVHVRKAAAKAQ
jgi:plastocyanin